MKKFTDDILSLPLSVRKEWAAALRSGKYRQGRGALLSSGRFCCLGVEGDVRSIPHDKMRNQNLLPRREYGLRGEGDFDPELVSPDNKEYAHIVTGHDDLLDSGYVASECNDDLELSFNQIADLIYVEKAAGRKTA